jgi:hypothetical protein
MSREIEVTFKTTDERLLNKMLLLAIHHGAEVKEVTYPPTDIAHGYCRWEIPFSCVDPQFLNAIVGEIK